MESGIKTKKIYIGGMTCIGCQNIIEKTLRHIAGIKKADVSYNSGTAVITYDTDIISHKDIILIIQGLDYEVLTKKNKGLSNVAYVIGWLVIIAFSYFFLEYFGILNQLVPSQLAETNMGYGMLFIIGLTTSVHCIAMCGGINLSQCIHKNENSTDNRGFSVLQPTYFYNLGRVISYTCIGFIVGALGFVITFSNMTQGILKLTAGVFMVIMGLNILDIFPWLRQFHPKIPKVLNQKINQKKLKNKSPFIIGLLNGFMPCGPLQMMQIYALSTGNPITGAVSMLLFGLGTVPLMFGFGAIGTTLGKKFKAHVMMVGAALLVVFGMSMFRQGWSLSGFHIFPISNKNNVQENNDENLEILMENDIQIVNSTLASYKYPTITVQAGVPVKWIIDAPKGSINGCNNRIFINEYDMEYKFSYGENIIEFTPVNTGTFKYYCWMGMLSGTINVVEN